MTEEKRIGRFSVFFGGIGPKVGPLSGKWHGEVKPKNDGKEIVSLSSAAVHSSNEMTLIFFNFSPQKNFFISRLRVLRHPSPSSPSPPLLHIPSLPCWPPFSPSPPSPLAAEQKLWVVFASVVPSASASTSTLSCGKGGVGGELTLTTFYDWTIVGKGWRGGWKETSIFRTSKTDKNGKSYWTTLSRRIVQARKRNKGENETEKRKMRKELHLGSRFVRSMNVLRTWESFEETTTRREKFTKGRWSCSNYGHLAGFSLKKGLSEKELERERERGREQVRENESKGVCVCESSFFVSLPRLSLGYLFPMQECVE